MKHTSSHRYREIVTVLSALICVLMISLAGSLLADQFWKTDLVKKSKFVTALFSEEQLDLSRLKLFGDRQTVAVMSKFTNAVADAAINLDFVPRRDTAAFFAVASSLRPEIEIDRFTLHRPDLVIIGTAEDELALNEFIEALTDQEVFLSIESQFTVGDTGNLSFTLTCEQDHRIG